MKKQKHRTSSGKMSERMSLLEFLKERSGIRMSKLEAYLDLVDKASVQYIPKDLCKQEFSLSNGQFVITITELAGCWHWHRATVRTFIEQLEKMNQISVTRLTKSQIITIPMLAETSAVLPLTQPWRSSVRRCVPYWTGGEAARCLHRLVPRNVNNSTKMLQRKQPLSCRKPTMAIQLARCHAEETFPNL